MPIIAPQYGITPDRAARIKSRTANAEPTSGRVRTSGGVQTRPAQAAPGGVQHRAAPAGTEQCRSADGAGQHPGQSLSEQIADRPRFWYPKDLDIPETAHSMEARRQDRAKTKETPTRPTVKVEIRRRRVVAIEDG